MVSAVSDLLHASSAKKYFYGCLNEGHHSE